MRRYVGLLLVVLALAGCATGGGQRIDEERVADANADIGIDYMRKGKYDLALTNLHKALRFNSDHVNANWALGITYSRLQEYGEAERYFARAAQLQPRPDILNSYGVFLCQRGQTKQAVANFRRAAENPRYAAGPDALANAGYCLVKAGQLEGAENYFRRALKRNPKQATALQQMAEINYRQKSYLVARAFMQRLDAATTLGDDSLLLGARIELARDERDSALGYLRRYNSNNPGAQLSLRQVRGQE